MKKQKICIIGGGLTGLITGLALSKLNLEIDLVTDNANKTVKSNRTIAISQSSYDFLRKLNIFKLSKKKIWSCAKMKLYTEGENEKFDEIFELNGEKKLKKRILYMVENSTIMEKLFSLIKKNNLIKFINKKKIYKIESFGTLKSIKFSKKNYRSYNLVIICTGGNSNLVRNIFKDQSIERSYNEVSITAMLNHSSIANNIARQIFLHKEILALLPLSNTRTSVVWTLNKNILNEYRNKKKFFLKNKLKFYAKNFLKKIKFDSNLEYKDLSLFIRKQYYQDRVLLFGDALHVVHPFVGQGFNMTLRDLASLQVLLKQKINLGLDIGSIDILSELSDKIKPGNLIYSLGIDFIKNLFSYEKNLFKDFRNKTLNKLNNNNFAKNLFFNLANKGIRF